MSEQASIAIERVGGVLVVTIDSPRRSNAVDAAMSRAIDAAVTAAEADPAIGAIVLTGSGDRAFCSGMDMKEAARQGAGLGLIPGRGFCGITERRVAKPLIAAVNGAAVAGGFELALACDIIIAAETAVFGLPEVKRGLVAFTGGVQRLARQLPRSAAMEIIWTGEPVSAARLHRLGLVSRLVPAERLMAETLAFAEACLANSWFALGLAKSLFDHALDHSFDEAIAHGHEIGKGIFAHQDAREGVAAYVDKRHARFGATGERKPE